MSGRIPQHFIEQLLARVDLVEVVNARVPLRKAGREYTACCPFHDEKSPSFTVSPTKQFYHCFGCGAHGNAISFVMNYDHSSFVDAVTDLAALVGLEVPREAQIASETPQDLGLYSVLESASRYFQQQLRRHPQAASAVDYLKARGISGEVAAEYELGYAPAGWDGLQRAIKAPVEQLLEAGLLIQRDDGGYYDRFRERVMFPIRDSRGRVIGFGGRVLDNGTPKYLNSPETPVFHKGRELYGLYQARKAERKLDAVIVVEGYMDVIALAQHGIRNSVATLGTATTADHLQRLFRVVAEVLFCFDGDRAGRQAAWRALQAALPVLREGRTVRFVFLPEGEDPDTLIRKEGRESVLERISQAMGFSEFFFETLLRSADITTVDGRARLLELAKPLLLRMAPGALRQMLVARLAELVRLELSRVEALLFADVKPDQVTQSVRARRGRGKQMTLVRKAVVLLLNRPALAARVDDVAFLESMDMAGAALLHQLLVLLQQRPGLNCASILEYWRGEEAGVHLARLAQEVMGIPEEGMAAEFDGAMTRLRALHHEQRLECLLTKSKGSELSQAEKVELNRLLLSSIGS